MAPAIALRTRAASARPLRVVASFSILADLVRCVAGDDATVAPLVGPDADVHVFEPTPADARRVRDADLVVVNGLRFEGWLDRLLDASEFRGRLVVATAGIEPRRRGAAVDPQAWQDLRHARRYVENISDPRLAQRIAAEAGVTVGGTLYSEALSRPGTEAETFLRTFEHNASALAAALGA